MSSSSKKVPVETPGSSGAAPAVSPAGRSKARKKAVGGFQSGREFKKKDLALVHLRQEVLSQNLKPGTLITAKGLAEKWGISRTPIRAAIDVLVKEGLLKRIGEAGAVVREINLEELYELLTLRYAIETRVARRFACMKTDDMLRKLDQLNEKMRAAVEADYDGGWPGYYELDIEFHVTMAKLANMHTAANWITELMNQFRLYALDYRGIGRRVYDEHKAIVDNIRGFELKDKENWFYKIEDAVRSHFMGTADRWVVNIRPWIDAEWGIVCRGPGPR